MAAPLGSGIDPDNPRPLTAEQVRAIFGEPAPLGDARGLFARRLEAFVNERGL